MKFSITIVNLILLFTSIAIFADTPCKKCDIEKVKTAYEHLDSLTYEMVNDFLCTFDNTCKTNVEYSEWSNEILYKVILKSTELYFQVVGKRQINNKVLLREIENPILDFDLQDIYEKVKYSSAPKGIKSKYLNAIVKAGSKNNQIINRRMCHG